MTLVQCEFTSSFSYSTHDQSRALTNGIPSGLTPEYYGQRASQGLINSEGTQPSEDGQGYLNMPGIYIKVHIQVWGIFPRQYQ
ncbi:hypothetical protein P9E76_00215 [Schinkia azotoformans]|nr:hypothetical protein [Schinkia azotoformans]MEC1640072.1 hypothetical protein [Schinkia azotoformans]MEC1943510.1 hypothetical protein [Schinkia azotoformans]